MARPSLSVAKRDEIGTHIARRLRLDGVIPGIIYGKGKESMPVQINIKDIHAVKGTKLDENVLLDLNIKDSGKELHKTVIVKELQRDIIKGDLLHIDFNEISLKEKLKTKVEIRLTGEAVGVAQGGILDHITHDLEIECLPTDIPSFVSLDVSTLTIGQAIYIKDIVVPEKVSVLSNPELPVVSVKAPRAEEEVVAAPAEGEAQEPEVIGKGKKEEEEEVPAEEAKEEKAKAEVKPKAEAKPKEEKKEK